MVLYWFYLSSCWVISKTFSIWKSLRFEFAIS